MGILSGNPKDEPLHFGEIYNIWTASTLAKGLVSSYQVYYYHAGDKDLKKILEDLIEQAKLEVSECDLILTENGIVPAPHLPERPVAKFDDIPVGARLSDQEIGAAIGIGVSAGLVACSQVIGQAIREDVAALFAKYHLTKVALGARILRLGKEKGWIIPPPLQIKRPDGESE